METDARLFAARDRLAQLQYEAHAAAEETALIAARIEQEVYSAWSRGREVRVTVGPDALIQGVEFTPGATTKSPRSLAAATLDAHRRALELLRMTVEDVVGSIPGSAHGLADDILGSARTMLPASGETGREPGRGLGHDDRR